MTMVVDRNSDKYKSHYLEIKKLLKSYDEYDIELIKKELTELDFKLYCTMEGIDFQIESFTKNFGLVKYVELSYPKGFAYKSEPHVLIMESSIVAKEIEDD